MRRRSRKLLQRLKVNEFELHAVFKRRNCCLAILIVSLGSIFSDIIVKNEESLESYSLTCCSEHSVIAGCLACNSIELACCHLCSKESVPDELIEFVLIIGKR